MTKGKRGKKPTSELWPPTKEWLVEHYVEKRISMKDCGQILAVSRRSIFNYLIKYSIPVVSTRIYTDNSIFKPTSPTFVDETGNRFGNLTVVEIAGVTKRCHVIWNCICDCGDYIEKPGKTLRYPRGGPLKCRICAMKDNRAKIGYKEISRDYFSSCKRGAVSRNFVFEISIEDCWNKYIEQNRLCAITGLPISFRDFSGNSSSQTASLDRIDSTKGYTKDNIQWLHKDVNLMKNHFQQERFLEICELATNFKKENNERTNS